VPEELRAPPPPRLPARRLFFALWPDEAMRQAMAEATRAAALASSGRPVSSANLHVTLAFLGSVPERQLPRLTEIGRGVAQGPGAASAAEASSGSPLELAFDHLEHWRAAQLLCALPPQPPAPTVALARRLQARLTGGGFTPDLKPFRPHVTVARKVSRPSPTTKMHPVIWRFAELALVESRTLPDGALYSVVQAYLL